MEAKSINITIILQDIRHTTLENLVKVVKVQYENIILQIEVNNLGVYFVGGQCFSRNLNGCSLLDQYKMFSRFVSVTDEFFLLNESVIAPDTKKATKFTCNDV